MSMTASEKASNIVFRGCFILLWLQPLARQRLTADVLLAGWLAIVLLNRFAALQKRLQGGSGCGGWCAAYRFQQIDERAPLLS